MGPITMLLFVYAVCSSPHAPLCSECSQPMAGLPSLDSLWVPDSCGFSHACGWGAMTYLLLYAVGQAFLTRNASGHIVLHNLLVMYGILFCFALQSSTFE